MQAPAFPASSPLLLVMGFSAEGSSSSSCSLLCLRSASSLSYLSLCFFFGRLSTIPQVDCCIFYILHNFGASRKVIRIAFPLLFGGQSPDMVSSRRVLPRRLAVSSLDVASRPPSSSRRVLPCCRVASSLVVVPSFVVASCPPSSYLVTVPRPHLSSRPLSLLCRHSSSRRVLPSSSYLNVLQRRRDLSIRRDDVTSSLSCTGAVSAQRMAASSVAQCPGHVGDVPIDLWRRGSDGKDLPMTS